MEISARIDALPKVLVIGSCEGYLPLLQQALPLRGCQVLTALVSTSSSSSSSSSASTNLISVEEIEKLAPSSNAGSLRVVIATDCTGANTSASLAPIELAAYALVRKCAAAFEQCVVLVDKHDVEVFIGGAGVAGQEAAGEGRMSSSPPFFSFSLDRRRELAAKAFLACSERDKRLFEKLTISKRVLVIGGGGREHAIAVSLAKSEQVGQVLVCPGNGGTGSAGGKISNLTSVSADDKDNILSYARQEGIALVVVGPEKPLCDGLVDVLEAGGVPCFGPSQRASMLEASKAWSKDFMERNGIPTAVYKTFTDFEQAKSFLQSTSLKRVVVKASGLAAGKGVLMPTSMDEAIDACKQIMVDKVFGDAGGEVVVEEFLQGEEVSLLAFSDGVTAIGMPGAQDHKRVFDNDQGPNTGGMGAYAPTPLLTPALRRKCMAIVQVRGF